jgi:biopolymer transport protein ExbB/TolQ
MDNAWIEAAGKMGVIARGVAVVHILMSIIVVAIALQKWREARARKQATTKFAAPFARALAENKPDQAMRIADDHPASPAATVLGAALSAAFPFVGVPGQGDYAANLAEVAAEREQGRIVGKLRGGLNALATIGATATLLGLLGTVVGIFNSFSALAESGGGSVDAIAVGAGEALLNTAMGITVAIPALWLYTYWAGRADKTLGDLDFATREVVQWVLVKGGPEIAVKEPVEPFADDSLIAAGVG